MLLGWGESRETENSLPVSCDLRLRLMQYHSVLVLSGIELMLLYLPFFFFLCGVMSWICAGNAVDNTGMF